MNTLSLLQLALGWQAQGLGASCAVVVETFGSAPRPKGSLMVMADDGRFEGSVSGGCIENEVMMQAKGLAGARLLTFDISDDTALLNGLPCGGAMRVLVFSLAVHETDVRAAVDALAKGHTATLTLADCAVGLEPAPRLLIVGGVHIAQLLSQMAALSGFEVTVIDPRTAYANVERFPGITLVNEWPDEAIAALKPDASTAIVTLSHDAKFDVPALQAALGSEAFYIGALGSRKTQLRRRAALDPTLGLHRIHGPVGLDIGAQTPAEIAQSILSEITQARRAPKNPNGIATLVLAAGISARLGDKDKLTLPIANRPLLEWTLRAALAAASGPVFVVTQPGVALPALAGVQQIPNPDYAQGLASSLRAGISAIQRLPQPVRGVMVLPGDKPHISWQTLDRIATQAADGPLRASYRGTPGHPAYLPASAFPKLLALTGDEGAKALNLAWEILELTDPAIVEDVDTWDDYERILENWPKEV